MALSVLVLSTYVLVAMIEVSTLIDPPAVTLMPLPIITLPSVTAVAMPTSAETDPDPPSAMATPLMVIELLDSLLLAMDPANMALVTTPVDEV